MEESSSFPISDLPEFKEKLLLWANQFAVFICLDSHSESQVKRDLEFVVAVDQTQQLSLFQEENHFERLKDFRQKAKNTIYGYLSYDLKNELEDLQSANPDGLEFPQTFFFEPRYIFSIQGNYCTINRSTLEALHLMDQVQAMKIISETKNNVVLDWESRLTNQEYLKQVREIQNDILEGTVYELNYCRELFAHTKDFSSLNAFKRINQKAKAPFSAYLKMDDKHVVSFSPERFIQHNNGKLLSQPIKGTIPKGKTEQENTALRTQLLNDEKERAENVMIVDLVRNDFARSAIPGSVEVDELFGIYEFENIIQMISTVSAKINKDIHPIDALKNAFPMGSMTGAPKIMAMKLIEDYERSLRGVYSGALGYIKPNLDYDFSVLIRTLLYNESKAYLSFQVGGAITHDAIPEKEWEETKIKANSILDFL